MAGEYRGEGERRNPAGLSADSEERLTSPQDHPQPSTVSVSLPQPPVGAVGPDKRSEIVATDLQDVERDPVVLANRARLAALYELRSPAPVDAYDAFLGCFWLLIVFAISGAIGEMLLELQTVWAAVLALAVDLGGTFVLLSELERRENKLMRACQQGIVDVPPRPQRR